MRRLALVVLALALGCARATTPPVEVTATPAFGRQPVHTLAVLPAAKARTTESLPPKALPTATDLLARAASREVVWRVVEPQDVERALGSTDGDLVARAGEAAAKTGADATLTVEVARWHERVGSDYGVSEPASVALRLILVPRGSAEAVWKADYAFTQEPLSYNLWNLWGALRGGPGWLTAAELARIGIEEAVSRLAATGASRR